MRLAKMIPLRKLLFTYIYIYIYIRTSYSHASLYMFYFLNIIHIFEKFSLSSMIADTVEGLDGDNNEEQYITLISKNKAKILLPINYIGISKLLQTSLEEDKSADEIELNCASEKIVELVVEYIIHHKGTPGPEISIPLRTSELKNACKDQWDVEFMERVMACGKQTLYDLILCANYMDIACLLNLGCATVATLLKGHPMEDIEAILRPENEEPSAGQPSPKRLKCGN